MAFGTTPAGTITKEQTLLSIRRLPVANATTVTKGNVVELNGNGGVIVSPVGQTVKVNHFVALETVADQIVGIYWGKEGGTIAKAAGAPYLESFTDNADFPPSDAAAGDVIEVQLVD